MIAALKAGIAVALVFGFAACACNRDKDAQTLVDELGSLDDAVEATVRASPIEGGLAKAEALLEAKRGSLHQRVVALKDADLSTAAAQSMSSACARNQQNGKIIEGHVAASPGSESANRALRALVDAARATRRSSTRAA